MFAPDQIFYGFFEELCDDPKPFVTRLLHFLGVGGGGGRELPLPAPLNRAAAGRRPPPEFERALAASLLPMVQRLCERFDGPPQDWHARYRALLGVTR